MNELNSLFNNTAFVVNLIIQLILLIIFLRLASNVGKIHKHLTASSSYDLNLKAEKAIFKGDNETAIDAYLDMMFILSKKTDDYEVVENTKEIKSLQKKVEALGGKVPEIK